jgi:hypothetical protein
MYIAQSASADAALMAQGYTHYGGLVDELLHEVCVVAHQEVASALMVGDGSGGCAAVGS